MLMCSDFWVPFISVLCTIRYSTIYQLLIDFVVFSLINCTVFTQLLQTTQTRSYS